MRFRTRITCTLIAASAIAFGCSEDEKRESVAWPDSIPDEVIGEFRTEETDSGRVQWRLYAPLARRFAKQESFFLDEPKILFFDDTGVLQTTLVSKYGEYLQKDGSMLAYGDVVVTTVTGDILETDSLRYLNEQDKIVSDSFVKFTRGNDVLSGIGFEADNNLSSVTIKENVVATIKDEDASGE
jgi:LPS export ABC transporter protein LptC